jgi:hypothetical protein
MLPAFAMLVFANEIASIFQEALGYQRLVMRPGPYTTAGLRMVLRQAHLPVKWADTSKTLLDLRQATVISATDQRWMVAILRSYLVPPLLPERVAHLVAADVFARLSHRLLLVDALHPALTYKAFDDEPEALRWLLR